MKTKVKLDKLKVSSFITEQQTKQVKGGNLTNPGQSTNCHTLYGCGGGSGGQGSVQWCAV